MKYPSIEWLLLVFISFSLTIHNVNYLPNLKTELVKIALTFATLGMALIIFIYYPYQAVKKQNERRRT